MKTLDQISGMPKIKSAFMGWMSNVTLLRVDQTIVDGFVEEDSSSTTFRAAVQPLEPEKLKLKPEGERSWEWLQMHTRPGVALTTNDRIRYNGVNYKIMAKLDYTQNDFLEYHLVKDYQDE